MTRPTALARLCERQRVRCVFSDSLRDNALDLTSGTPPGGLLTGRSVARVLQSSPSFFSSAGASVVDDLVTTAFPVDCRACGGPLLHATPAPVCEACLSRLTPQSRSLATALCRLCGESLDMEGVRSAPREGLICASCRLAPPPFVRAVAYGVYEDELREMIHLLKYDGMAALAKPLGAKLAEAILMLEREEFWTGDAAVIGVPLFTANERQRGFNQSVLLADAAVSTLRRLRPNWKLRPSHAMLQRVRATESQFNLSTRGRRRNLVGAFNVQEDRSAITGRDVLLIDDIYTTGATSRACAQALRRAGARRVWVATLARAQREQVEFWSSSSGDAG